MRWSVYVARTTIATVPYGDADCLALLQWIVRFVSTLRTDDYYYCYGCCSYIGKPRPV